MTELTDYACTLFEGDYQHGVCALANSLYAAGFRGIFFVGYKGSLPRWASVNEAGIFAAATDFKLKFIKLDTPWHLANFKPQFMLDLLNLHAPDATKIAYFDPDIVVTCRWQFYRDWLDSGICAVQEVTNGGMPSTHPLRRAWAQFLVANGGRVRNSLERYFNSGFFSVRRDCKQFLVSWQKLIIAVLKVYPDLATQFLPGNRSDIFYCLDQDCFNMALMDTPCPSSVIGPEGMGFVPGGFTMQHAVGSPKPWRFKLLNSLVSGNPPSSAIKAFWGHTEGPILSFSTFQRELFKTRVKIAAMVGRFSSRS